MASGGDAALSACMKSSLSSCPKHCGHVVNG
jgi:hypothetical protein